MSHVCVMAAIYTVASPDRSTDHIYLARMASQHMYVVINKDVCQNESHLFLKAKGRITDVPFMPPFIWNPTIPA